MHDFKRLKVWHKAINLVTGIYQVTKYFPKEEKFGLISQLRRAAVSIPSNIAEGCGRNSGHQLIYFLNVAKASSFELETQMIIAENLGWVDREISKETINKFIEIQKMLNSLMRKSKDRK